MTETSTVVYHEGLRIRRLLHDGCEVYDIEDTRSDLKLFIAFTGTRPSIGGIRWVPALADVALETVCKLARAMAYKACGAGMDADGVKMFVYAGRKTPALLRRVGQVIEYFGGRHLASVDMGTTVDDMMIIREMTRFVSVLNPSPETARSVISCLVMWAHRKRIPLLDLSVYITGVCGGVASEIAHSLIDIGITEVWGRDITDDRRKIERMENIGVRMIPYDDFPRVHAYMPCACGDVLNPDTIPAIVDAHIQAVIGSANCPFADVKRDSTMLYRKGVMCATDWVANRGGLIWIGGDPNFGLVKDPIRRIRETGHVMSDIWDLSHEEGIPETLAAERHFGITIESRAA